ncbi:unnamed protein product [Rhodiola kirilowii]
MIQSEHRPDKQQSEMIIACSSSAIARLCIHPTPFLHRARLTDSPHQFLFPSSHRSVPPFLRDPPVLTAFRPPSAALSDALLQDSGATAAVLCGAYFLVLGFDKLTEAQILEQSLSRKLVHIASGLLFMASWPSFSTSFEARYFAALVPLINCMRLVANGFSLVTDGSLVKSVTREGNPKELLRGPLYYVIILILSATVFWRASPVGVVSVAMMCGGDGIADIIGRRYGFQKLPYNHHKSWLGSLSMFVCGSLISTGMLYYFTSLGCFSLDWSSTLQKVVLVSLVATFVESLPITKLLDDNLSVPLASMVTALLVFGY